MKRQLLIAAAVLIAGSGVLVAQDTYPPEADPNEMNGQIQMSCPMCMMMAGHLFKSELVATADGGALLMIGGALYKYDANLTLVAQTQLQIDLQQIQTQLQDMMSNCPMCQQKMQMMKQWRGRGGRSDQYGMPEGNGTTGNGNGQTNGTGTNGMTESNGQSNGAAESESLKDYQPNGQSSHEKKSDKPETKQPEETRL
jgi:hypothetical protein